MTVEMIRKTLGWCTIINYGVLMVWVFAFMLGHDFVVGLHGRLFHLSATQLDALHYGGIGLFKMGILMFNLVPYIALRIAMRGQRG
jgi:hypothetical protein